VDLPQHKVLKVFYLIVGWFACEWHKVPSIDESIMWSSMLGKCFQIQKKKCLRECFTTTSRWHCKFETIYLNIQTLLTKWWPPTQSYKILGNEKEEKKKVV
jgi:hypothetical protein